MSWGMLEVELHLFLWKLRVCGIAKRRKKYSGRQCLFYSFVCCAYTRVGFSCSRTEGSHAPVSPKQSKCSFPFSAAYIRAFCCFPWNVWFPFCLWEWLLRWPRQSCGWQQVDAVFIQGEWKVTKRHHFGWMAFFLLFSWYFPVRFSKPCSECRLEC